jgi:hypothetical protein
VDRALFVESPAPHPTVRRYASMAASLLLLMAEYDKPDQATTPGLSMGGGGGARLSSGRGTTSRTRLLLWRRALTVAHRLFMDSSHLGRKLPWLGTPTPYSKPNEFMHRWAWASWQALAANGPNAHPVYVCTLLNGHAAMHLQFWCCLLCCLSVWLAWHKALEHTTSILLLRPAHLAPCRPSSFPHGLLPIGLCRHVQGTECVRHDGPAVGGGV